MQKKSIVLLIVFLSLGILSWSSGTPSAPATAKDAPTTITLLQRGDTIGVGDFKTKGLYKFLLEKFNVDLKVDAVPNTVFRERLQLVMLSGDLPDFIAGSGDVPTINKYGTQGLLYECEKLLPVMPNWQAFLEQYPYIRKDITASDGHIYALNSGTMEDYFVVGYVVKKNMLDSVGFDLSKVDTFDDYYAMLTALKKANGGKPVYDHRSGGEVWRIIGQWLPPVGIWIDSEFPDNYDDTKDKFFHPYTDDKVKFVVEFLRKLYAEGIMHPDIIQHTEDDWEPDMTQLKWPFFVDNVGFGYGNELRMKLTNPSEPTDFRAIKPPKYQGKQYPWRMRDLGGVEIILSKKTQHANKIGAMLDWFRSIEGGATAKYGIENADWVMIDGLPRPLWRFLGNNYKFPSEWEAKTKTEEQWNQFISNDWGYVKVFGDIGNRAFYITGAHINSETKYHTDYYPIYKKIFTALPVPIFPLLAEDQDEIMSLRNALNTASYEIAAKIITGLSPMSEWTTLQNLLKSIGVDRYVELINKSYQVRANK